jgi:hypothetical protein
VQISSARLLRTASSSSIRWISGRQRRVHAAGGMRQGKCSGHRAAGMPRLHASWPPIAPPGFRTG